jgi:predicted DNA-binding WGR domain protein
MVANRSDLVHLRRIDPSRGMGRFYSLTLQPTLLGGVDLVRRWGRLGTSGGSMLTEAYPDEASAQAALEKLAARKRRRGYA